MLLFQKLQVPVMFMRNYRRISYLGKGIERGKALFDMNSSTVFKSENCFDIVPKDGTNTVQSI